MARKIAGNDVFLFIDVTTSTTSGATPSNWDTVVCLTNKSLKRVTQVIDAASQCGPDTLAGNQTITVDFEGQQLLDPATNELSGAYLHDVWADKRTFHWKLSKVATTSDDVVYTGQGFLSNLDDSYGDNNPSTFNGSIAVKGSISRVVIGS